MPGTSTPGDAQHKAQNCIGAGPVGPAHNHSDQCGVVAAVASSQVLSGTFLKSSTQVGIQSLPWLGMRAGGPSVVWSAAVIFGSDGAATLLAALLQLLNCHSCNTIQ
jgi:hypothetical protein